MRSYQCGYDQNGVTDIMLDLLEFERSDKILEPVMPDGTGYVKYELPIATHAKALAECCKKAFDCTVVTLYPKQNGPIKRVAVCSGASLEAPCRLLATPRAVTLL